MACGKRLKPLIRVTQRCWITLETGLIAFCGTCSLARPRRVSARQPRYLSVAPERYPKEHPMPLSVRGVRGETTLRYKENGGADLTEHALVRARSGHYR